MAKLIIVCTIPIVQECYEFPLRHPLLIGLFGSGACLLSARQDWARARSELAK